MADHELRIPGTVQLIELTRETSSQADIVLIPAPSDNINDPLNWSKTRKILIAAILLVWTFFANAAIAWTSPAWAVWTAELNTTFTLLNYGQAVLVIMCGISVFFLQPWALKYGRRGVYAFGSVLIIAGLIAGVFMTNINGFFAYMILSGFGSSPSYATIVTSLMDVSFQHQRGRMISLYGICLVAGNFLPPVPAGYIVDSQGWKWCFYYLIIFFVISTMGLLFFAEESIFPRAPSGSTLTNAGQPEDKQSESFKPIKPSLASNNASEATKSSHQLTDHALSKITSRAPSAHIPSIRYTYIQQMTLFRSNLDVKVSYLRLTFQVLELLALPAPVWTSAMNALGTFVVGLVFTTQASLFAIPPYNFTPAQLGLMYFALLIGNCLGSIYAGPFSDALVLRLARRNGGISEAEHRLYAYHPVSFIALAGIILYGVGASQGIHWAVPCLGLIFIGFYLNASLPIALAYGLDAYPELAGETIQLSNFIKNVTGGAFTFAIQPWINHNGAQTTSVILEVLVLVLNLTSIPLHVWGKSMRRKTTLRYQGIVKRSTYY